MPFSVCKATHTFQWFMDEFFWGLTSIYAFVDDILITSAIKSEHLNQLHEEFSRLIQYGLRINLEKCILGVKQLSLCGHTVSEEGISAIQIKVDAIAKFPTRRSFRQLRRFVDLLTITEIAFHTILPF